MVVLLCRIYHHPWWIPIIPVQHLFVPLPRPWTRIEQLAGKATRFLALRPLAICCGFSVVLFWYMRACVRRMIVEKKQCNGFVAWRRGGDRFDPCRFCFWWMRDFCRPRGLLVQLDPCDLCARLIVVVVVCCCCCCCCCCFHCCLLLFSFCCFCRFCRCCSG